VKSGLTSLTFNSDLNRKLKENCNNEETIEMLKAIIDLQNMDNKNKYGKLRCACCCFFTINEIKETCPVCFWEEDFYQQENMDDSGGPNLVSLREAKVNYKSFGATEKRFINFVRPPEKDEIER
jgi:hypothetical protein